MKPKSEIPTDSDYLRGQGEASRYARVSRRTISDWQTRQVIQFLKVSHKIVLFRKSDIDKALSQYAVKAV